MAQTGYTPLLIYSSTTSSQAPAAGNLTNSTLGSELAINITDGKLFYKDDANAVQVIAWKTTPTSAGGTGLTSYSAGDLLYYASGTTLTKLTIGASGRWLGSSGTAPQWNAPAALTKTDDTNVTLTLGGSASTALLNAASLTLGWTGQLSAARGGTGVGTYAVGDLLYADTTSSLAKLADVATGNALISGGVGVAPSWGKIGLTTHVSGTLPIANGGTNLTSFTANGLMYASSTSALATSSNLIYNGANFAVANNTSDGTYNVRIVSVMGTSTTYLDSDAANVFGAGLAEYQFQNGTATRPAMLTLGGTLNANEALGAISFFRSGNSDNYRDRAYIYSYVTNTGTADQYGGGLVFSTAADGATNPSERIRILETGVVQPGGDNTQNFGAAAKRWATIYAGNGTINTSDANEKTDVADLEDAEKRVAVRIKSLIKKFRYNDAIAIKGDGARIHVGVIAQDVQSAFESEGLDATRYGIFCCDVWWEKEVARENLVNIEAVPEGTEGAVQKTRLGVRYDQLLAFVIAAM